MAPELLSGKLRRSALYVPANNPRALAKSATLNADVLVFDLEDAVLAEQKPDARKRLAAHLAEHSFQAEIVLRINGFNTAAFADDVEWLAVNETVDAVLLPKARTPQQIQEARQQLVDAGCRQSLWVLVETVDAVINLAAIARLLEPGAALILGAEDLSREMRLKPTPGRLGLLPILSQLVLHARSAGLSVIDAMFPELDNELGFKQSCEQACNLGFDGKSLIHPNQIEFANQTFSPSADELERAEKIIASWQTKAAEQGVVEVDGMVIEQLHVEQAQQLIEQARLINSKLNS